MEIKDMLVKREELENDLADYIAAKVNEFIKESGVGLKTLQVSLTDFNEFGKKEPVLTMVSVDVNLNI